MNYYEILKLLDEHFSEAGFRYAVAGAFALHAYGLTRATADLDLVVDAKGRAGVLAFVEAMGYRTLHVSAGYSNHCHALGAMGNLDFIYIGGATAQRLFDGVRPLLNLRGLHFPVPRPEHLAAMKVFAVRNAPERTLRDLADVQSLLTLQGIDREEIRGYFEKYGLPERYREIEEALGRRGL